MMVIVYLGRSVRKKGRSTDKGERMWWVQLIHATESSGSSCQRVVVCRLGLSPICVRVMRSDVFLLAVTFRLIWGRTVILGLEISTSLMNRNLSC